MLCVVVFLFSSVAHISFVVQEGQAEDRDGEVVTREAGTSEVLVEGPDGCGSRWAAEAKFVGGAALADRLSVLTTIIVYKLY